MCDCHKRELASDSEDDLGCKVKYVYEFCGEHNAEMNALFAEESDASLRLAIARSTLRGRLKDIPIRGRDLVGRLTELFSYHRDDEPHLVASIYEFIRCVVPGFTVNDYNPPEEFQITDPVLYSLSIRHEVEVFLCKVHDPRKVYDAACSVFIPVEKIDYSQEMQLTKAYHNRILALIRE